MSEPFSRELLAFRARKDDFFRSGRGPLQGEALTRFSGLAYFPPDPAWRVSAPVEPLSDDLVTLATTSGEPRAMRLLGRVRLDLPGGEGRLTLFVSPDEAEPTQAFVPFRDATSGRSSYGAGRYLEADLHGGEATLDFNRAYHPYCAYGEGWNCPLPPAENTLALAVEAGERLPG